MKQIFRGIRQDCISRSLIGNNGIIVRRVMGKIRADDKEILPSQIGSQNVGNLLARSQRLDTKHDRNDLELPLQVVLQERELNFETMLITVGIFPL
jgi:hypothetical protein